MISPTNNNNKQKDKNEPKQMVTGRVNDSTLAINTQHIVSIHYGHGDEYLSILLSSGDTIKAHDMCLEDADEQIGLLGSQD